MPILTFHLVILSLIWALWIKYISPKIYNSKKKKDSKSVDDNMTQDSTDGGKIFIGDDDIEKQLQILSVAYRCEWHAGINRKL